MPRKPKATFLDFKDCFAWADTKCKVMTHKDCPTCNFYRSDIKYADQVKAANAHVKEIREMM